MIVARFAMLVLGCVACAAAWGALAMRLQPSAQRLVLTALVALLAPLFWPGAGPTFGNTLVRVIAWSIAVACLTLATLTLVGGVHQPLGRAATACAMLLLIMVVTHAVAAACERWLCDRSIEAQAAREMAGRAAVVTLAIVAAVPLWAGPAGEVLARPHPWVIDAIIGVSPLTHLAVASGNDLLRNEWLYDHSNLSRLAVSYPSLGTLFAFYGSVLLALALLPLAQRSPWRRSRGAGSTRTTMEDVAS